MFPFDRFPGVDVLLGPEMRSTGEVMGLDEDFGHAFLKAQLAANVKLPTEGGTVFLSVRDHDKARLQELGQKQREELQDQQTRIMDQISMLPLKRQSWLRRFWRMWQSLRLSSCFLSNWW